MTGYSITKSSLYEAYHTSPVFCGEFPIKGPDSLMHRYYTEDTTYGLVTWSSLGDLIAVETPTIDAIIKLISELHKTDYFSKGERNVEKLGISGMTVKEINHYLKTGQRS